MTQQTQILGRPGVDAADLLDLDLDLGRLGVDAVARGPRRLKAGRHDRGEALGREAGLVGVERRGAGRAYAMFRLADLGQLDGGVLQLAARGWSGGGVGVRRFV